MAEGTEMVDAFVFKDEKGELYALPVEILESFRVPEEHRAAAERAFEDGDDEVSGHAAPWTGWRPPYKTVQLPRQPAYTPPANPWGGFNRLIGDHGTGFRR